MRGDIRDIVSGAAIAGVGAFFAWRAFDYNLGTPRSMGPGFFPFALGIITMFVALWIIVPALFRQTSRFDVEWKPLIMILLSIAVFALAMRWLGLIPAVFASVMLSAAASDKFRLVPALVISAISAVAFWVLFPMGLGQAMPGFAGVLEPLNRGLVSGWAQLRSIF